MTKGNSGNEERMSERNIKEQKIARKKGEYKDKKERDTEVNECWQQGKKREGNRDEHERDYEGEK